MANDRCKACGWKLTAEYGEHYGAFAHFISRTDCVRYYECEGLLLKLEPDTPLIIPESLYVHKQHGLWKVSAVGVDGEAVTYRRSFTKGNANQYLAELQALIDDCEAIAAPTIPSPLCRPAV